MSQLEGSAVGCLLTLTGETRQPSGFNVFICVFRVGPVNAVTLRVLQNDGWIRASLYLWGKRWRREKARVLMRWSKKCWIISRLSQKGLSHTAPLPHPCPAFFPSHTHTQTFVCVCGFWAVPHVLGASHQIRPRWQKGLLHTGGCCGCKLWSQSATAPHPKEKKKKEEKETVSQQTSQSVSEPVELPHRWSSDFSRNVCMYVWCLDWRSVFCSTLMALDAWTKKKRKKEKE